MPLRAAAALFPHTSEVYRWRAVMTELGVRGVVRWQLSDDEKTLRAFDVDPRPEEDQETSWLRDRHTVRCKPQHEYVKQGSLQTAAEHLIAKGRQSANEKGLLRETAGLVESLWAVVGVAATIGYFVVTWPFAHPWFGVTPAKLGDEVPEWIANAYFYGVLFSLTTTYATLANALSQRNRGPTKKGEAALLEVAAVQDLVQRRLRGRFEVSAEDAQRLLPWAVLFGQGTKWNALLCYEYSPPRWLEGGDERRPAKRFVSFHDHVALQPMEPMADD